MKSFYKLFNCLTFLVLLSLITTKINAQCSATIGANPAAPICGNKTIGFSTGFTVATTFDFNSGTLPSGWVSSPFTVGKPCVTNTPDNSPYFWATTRSNGVRFVETNAVSVQSGGDIIFKMRYGSDDPAFGCEDPDLASEGVYLQYSNNGGTWTDIQSWTPNGTRIGPLYVWTGYKIAVPPGAVGTSTRFRWFQPSNSGDQFDNWGLEDVSIQASQGGITSYSWNFGDGTTSNLANPSKTYSSDGNYNVSLTLGFDGGCVATSSKVVSIINNPIPVASNSGPTFSGSTLNLFASGGNSYVWSGPSGFSSTLQNPSIPNVQTNASGIYTVIVSNSSCSLSTTTTATVNALIPATALNFDGVDDFVSTGNSLGNVTGDFTIELNIKTTASGASYLFSKRAICNGDNFISIGLNFGKVGFEISDGNIYAGFSGSKIVNDNQWHHVAITRKSGLITILIDGVVDATAQNNANVNNNYIGTLGSSICNGQNISVKYKGEMDEVRFWNRALCAGEVLNNLNKELSLPQTGLLAYYQMNQGFVGANNSTINTLTDLIGNNTGTLSNFALTGTTSNWVAGTISGIAPTFVAPTATITANGPLTFCPSGSVTLSANAGTGLTYQWTKDGIDIPSANLVSYSANSTGSYSVVITQNGCTALATAVNVTVEDNIKPVVPVLADVKGQCSATATAPTTTDNCAGTITGTTTDAISYTTQGTHVITWSFDDGNGNVSTATQNVIVKDNIKPVVPVLADVKGQCSATATAPTTTDNCGGTVTGTTTDALSYTAQGTYVITWTFNDGNGNVSTATQNVIVKDDIKPVVPVLADIKGQCSATATAPTTTDNCAGTVTGTTSDALSYTTQGTYVITWSFDDGNGNVSTATQNVIVKDDTNPTVITQNLTVQLNAAGNVFITPSEVNNNSFDNCGIASYTLSKTSFDCTNVGNNTVTLTVTDVNGNASSAIAVVTVEDKIVPIITQLAFQEICFVASNTYSLPTLTATDNCSVASVSYVLSGATNRIGIGTDASGLLNTGLTTITWTVKDAKGNTSTSTNDVRIWALPVLTITPSNADVFCNEVSLSPSSTIPVVSYRWMYNNTLFSSSAVLKLSIANADGNYQLFVTDIHGCVNTQIASYNFQKQGTISSYTILGLKEVKLGENNKVLSGSVGAMGAKGKIDIKKNSSVAAAGAFVKAADIKVQSPSNVPTKIYAPVVTSLPTMQYFVGNTSNLAKVTASSNTTLTGNYKEVKINSGKTVTLSGNLFGKIEIEEGATVTFTSSVINIQELKVKGTSKSNYTYVNFSTDAIVKVSDKVELEKRTSLNASGKKIIFYVGSAKDHGKYYSNSHDDDDKCPSRKNDDDDDDDDDNEYGKGEFKVEGGESIVNANVYVPKGDIKVNGGEKLPTTMTGMFIAEKVEGNEKNVNWNGFSCNAPAAMLMATNSVQATESPKQTIEVASLELVDTKFLAYPNPFARQTTVSFSLPYQEENATVDIYDLRGVKLQSIFKGKAAAQTAVEVQFNGQNIAAGTYFFRLTTGKEVKNFKVIMSE